MSHGVVHKRAGWTRLSPPGDKCTARWRHVSGWTVVHCGHPTALWPYLAISPEGDNYFAHVDHASAVSLTTHGGRAVSQRASATPPWPPSQRKDPRAMFRLIAYRDDAAPVPSALWTTLEEATRHAVKILETARDVREVEVLELRRRIGRTGPGKIGDLPR